MGKAYTNPSIYDKLEEADAYTEEYPSLAEGARLEIEKVGCTRRGGSNPSSSAIFLIEHLSALQ